MRSKNGIIVMILKKQEPRPFKKTRRTKSMMKKSNNSKSARYLRCREELLSNGFAEARRKSGHFFRRATEKTAFVINLEDDEYACVSVLYGFASTACMAGEEEWFADHGSDCDTCQVRNLLCVWNDESEAEAREAISAFYDRYRDCSKDEILAVKKERQKAFLDHFARALKPLGFKKKGTRWTKELGRGGALSFEAQKSAYSDQYYFNVIVHTVGNPYAWDAFDRVVMDRSDVYNWQLMTEEQIDALIQYTLKKHINPKLK
jgi:hypothetical protein